MSKIRVLIADDIAQTRKEIQRLLLFEEDITVVGEARDGVEAVSLAQELMPDVVLMDISMPEMDGLKATEQISMSMPQVATIIVSIQGDQQYMKEAMRAGAWDYLVKPVTADDLGQSIRKVYRLHRQRFEARQKPPVVRSVAQGGRLVVVCSPKGGVGKTVLATNLGMALSQGRYGMVAVVDLDLQFGDLGLMLNLDNKRNMGSMVSEEENIDSELVDSCLIPHFSGLRVLLGPSAPQDAELITFEHVKRVLALIRQKYDWVVVDTPPGLSEMTLDVLGIADYIILVVTPDIATVKSVRSCLALLEAFHLRNQVKIVLNRANHKLGLKSGDVKKALEHEIWHQVPNEEALVMESINKGLPFVLSNTRTSISESFKAMAADMAGFTLAGKSAT